MSNVGRIIHLTRQVKGVAMSELASVIGRSEGHLQHVENGMLAGTPETLLAIADRLGISPDVLRDAYLQDAKETALAVWRQGEKCKVKCTNKNTN